MDYICSNNIEEREIYAGKEYITSMSQLYTVVINKDCKSIMIEKDFAEENFVPPYGITSFIEDVNRINPNINIQTRDNFIKTYEEDISLLIALQDKEDMLFYILKNKVKFFKLLKMLCKSYFMKSQDSLVANNKLATINLELQDTKIKLEESIKTREALEETVYNERLKLDTLMSRIKYTYEKDISTEFLNGIEIDRSNYSKILYIKEITRVHYVDSLIHYLMETIKILYDNPARFVVIESMEAYNMNTMYPMCKPHLTLNRSDIAYGNIFMAGYQQNILRDILLNTGRVPYLIVLDRTHSDKMYIHGDKVELMITASTVDDVYLENLENERIISYEMNTQHISYIDKFDKLSNEEKVSKYTSMDIMEYLINLLEKDSE